MKFVLASAALALLAIPSAASTAPAQAAPAAQSDEAAKLAEAHAIVEIIFPPAARQQMIRDRQADIMKQMTPLFPAIFQSDPGLKALFEEFKNNTLQMQRGVLEKHLPLQIEAMAQAYTREFSLTELRDIHAFGKTPSGNSFLSKSTAVLGDPAIVKVNSALFVDIKAVTDAALPPFQAKIETYLKAHPEVAAKIQAESKAN